MYLTHFGLEKRPFSITPDPSLMVWTSQHLEVFENLLSALSPTPAAASLTVLTGDIGCGKSTILRALLENSEIESRFRAVLISVAIASERDLSGHILSALDANSASAAREAFPERIAGAFAASAAAGLLPLLIIDEAQTMSPDAGLALARLLSDESGTRHKPSIILAGQTELKSLLASRELAPLSRHIEKRLRLGPLSPAETAQFIRGRISLAGAADSDIFDAGALAIIHAVTQGTPRLVNKVCDICLFAASRKNRQQIDANFLRRVLNEFNPFGLAPAPGSISPDAEPEILDVLTSFDQTKAQPVSVLSLNDDAEDIGIGKTADGRGTPDRPGAPDMPSAPERQTGVLGFIKGAAAAALVSTVALVLWPYVKTLSTPRSTDLSGTATPPSGLRFPNLTETIDWTIGFDPALSPPSTIDRTALDEMAPDTNQQKRFEAAQEELQRVTRELDAARAELAALRAQQAPHAIEDDAQDAAVPVQPAPEAFKEDGTGALAVAIKVLEPLPPEADTAAANSFFANALESNDLSVIAVNYSHAALRGHNRAAQYLGQLFETGDGVALDSGIARRWYRVSDDMARLHASDLVDGAVSGTPDLVIPLAYNMQDGAGDFVWHGHAEYFSLELADTSQTLLAVARTPLTAIRVTVPDGAAFWRVATDGGTASEWRPIQASPD